MEAIFLIFDYNDNHINIYKISELKLKPEWFEVIEIVARQVMYLCCDGCLLSLQEMYKLISQVQPKSHTLYCHINLCNS